jgi:hypothetical protein
MIEPYEAAKLRAIAEARMKIKQPAQPVGLNADTQRLLHELQVHRSNWRCKTRSCVLLRLS